MFLSGPGTPLGPGAEASGSAAKRGARCGVRRCGGCLFVSIDLLVLGVWHARKSRWCVRWCASGVCGLVPGCREVYWVRVVSRERCVA